MRVDGVNRSYGMKSKDQVQAALIARINLENVRGGRLECPPKSGPLARQLSWMAVLENPEENFGTPLNTARTEGSEVREKENIH